MSEREARGGKRREHGIALIATLLLMALLAMVGMASLETMTADRRVGGFLSRAHMALYAAEAGVENATRDLADANLPAGAAALENFTLAVPATNIGDSSLYPYGRPGFRGDPSVANPVAYLGSAGPCEEWTMSIEVGGPMYLYSLWDIRVQGETADGASTRVQASATRCYAYDG